MLDQLTLDFFRPHVGKPFAVVVDEERFMPAHLVDARPLTIDDDPRRRRAPFVLTFRGPSGGQLPQRIYAVRAEGLEPMELFLVPVGPDGGEGMLYEAVFT